ncbi:MAG: glucose-1-phosphate cytidylyltransferase [Bacilli bacterium]|jgi:glucose-1-phosphate cytidylyltransferase
MKVVILAGGRGTRISEESHLKPKPMIEIGGMPILWHIMKLYSHYGYNEFIICAGYKQEYIKEYFANYAIFHSDVTFDFSLNGQLQIHYDSSEPWKVTVVDTGFDTMTGGRIKRIQKYIGKEQFLVTYGDGVSDVNISELVKYHKEHGKIMTITSIQPEGRFGFLEYDSNNLISSFREKDKNDSGWINGGFMVVGPEIFDYIDGDDTIFERKPIESLASIKQVAGFKHYGFWQCMDTLRDKEKLDLLWSSGEAPWKVW